MTPIDITPETAIKVASQYRLDWMNARADLVNSWRDIEIAANQLQSVLSFSVDGTLGTDANNPVAFDRRNGKISVGVEWDAPMTRLVERNVYRTAQINYQRARRDYYNYVDGVNRSLRDALRNIDNVQFDFEVQRRSVFVAISRVHLAQLAMEKPPEPGQTSESMSNTLARDLVEALNSLQNASHNDRPKSS
jgi:outer membrane protein TolC